MSQQNSKKTLINWDLVSVNPNDKNWNWRDLFCFWAVSIQSVIGFSLIASLYLVYDLNFYVVLESQPNDNLVDIRKRYLKLSKEHHPDLLLSKGVPEEVIEESKKTMRAINSAWDQVQKLKKN